MRSENNTESTAFKEEEAKILELSLFKTGSGRQTKVSYQDTLKAFVECQGLEGDTIDLYLCQGDEKTIICQDVLVDRYGIAETSIPLLSSDITTDLIINQEKESGEVYIAAVYNDQEVKSDTFKITSEVVTFESGNSPVKVGVVEVEEKEEILDPIDENISSNIIVKKIYEIDSFNDDTPLSIKEDRKMEEIKLHTLNAIYIDKTNISIILNIVNKENIQGCFIYPIITNIPDIEKDPEQYEESISDVDFSVSMIENKNWYKENTIGKNVTEIDLRLIFNKKTYESLYLDIFTFKETLTPQHQLKIKIEFKKIDTYHIYYDGNIEKYIFNNLPYDKEKKYKYVYHDEKGNEHEICIVNYILRDKLSDKGQIIQSIPKGYISTYDYPEGGNAQKAYVYSNGDIIVEGTKYGIRKYVKDNGGQIELVRMADSLSYNERGVSVFYTFKGTQRRYCNPDCYAGFIGVLAEIGSTNVECSGMCFEDATSYPSLTHPNGDSADTIYFTDFKKEQEKVNAFKKFHFTKIYRGKTGWYPNLKGTIYSAGHEDHLHSGEFDSNAIKIIKK